MVLKTIHAKGPKGSELIESQVRKARTQAGVERILVVYEAEATHIYVEGEPVPKKGNNARAS